MEVETDIFSYIVTYIWV